MAAGVRREQVIFIAIAVCILMTAASEYGQSIPFS